MSTSQMNEKSEESEIKDLSLKPFPSKPRRANFNRNVDLITNSYKLDLVDANI